MREISKPLADQGLSSKSLWQSKEKEEEFQNQVLLLWQPAAAEITWIWQYYRVDALGERHYLHKYHYVAFSETITCVKLKSPVSL